jgi:8-oxo-dGTP diphosphatase
MGSADAAIVLTSPTTRSQRTYTYKSAFLGSFCYDRFMKIPISDVIFVDNGKVLLVQQRKEIAYGLWSYPGGHVEAGETPEEAVHREIREELGATLVNARFFKIFPLKTPTSELEIHSYVGELEGDIVLKDDELMAYGWFSLESLESMQDKLRYPEVLEQARQVLELQEA